MNLALDIISKQSNLINQLQTTIQTYANSRQLKGSIEPFTNNILS